MSSKTDKEVLLDMGFEEIRINKALAETNNSGLQPAMDWLFAHADDPIESFIEDSDAPTSSNEVNKTTNDTSVEESTTNDNNKTSSSSDAVARSLVCNVCKKIIKDAQAAEFHAIKTGHQDFSESTEAIKPLTEEEKKAKLEELKERLKEKRLMKQKEEQEYEKQKEKVRRRTGKELNEARERMEKEELKRIYEKKKREQIEERKARARVKAQIEQDRKERAAKLEEEKRLREGKAMPQSNSNSSINLQSSASESIDYSETSIQIRMPGMPPLVQDFNSSDTLQKVYEFLLSKKPEFSGYSFSTTYPRKVFTEQDKSKTLKELDLVPSSVLVLVNH
ncbi:UBX-domain-containing protein [Anaeromyces robustus]|uniref:UBX-domain-containing protein n=1 Tax=Anaeromyces robustus TaxID=1754192 RepID=A0A1Y1XRI8_9FUNG|nr:UBX-domain-containing protein [Anaeromyces robustus]|eukprot:ORX88275.1 UBX-domain-containing protein [Anaeromyces robustus]